MKYALLFIICSISSLSAQDFNLSLHVFFKDSIYNEAKEINEILIKNIEKQNQEEVLKLVQENISKAEYLLINAIDLSNQELFECILNTIKLDLKIDDFDVSLLFAYLNTYESIESKFYKSILRPTLIPKYSTNTLQHIIIETIKLDNDDITNSLIYELNQRNHEDRKDRFIARYIIYKLHLSESKKYFKNLAKEEETKILSNYLNLITNHEYCKTLDAKFNAFNNLIILLNSYNQISTLKYYDKDFLNKLKSNRDIIEILLKNNLIEENEELWADLKDYITYSACGIYNQCALRYDFHQFVARELVSFTFLDWLRREEYISETEFCNRVAKAIVSCKNAENIGIIQGYTCE